MGTSRPRGTIDLKTVWPHLYPHQTVEASNEQVKILMVMDNCKFHIHRSIWKEDDIDVTNNVPYPVKTLLGRVVIGIPLNDYNIMSIQVEREIENDKSD